MSINNHWRNKQLVQDMSWQEKQCINFCQMHKEIKWGWHGKKSNFYMLCNEVLDFDNNNTGAIIINTPIKVTIDDFIKQIKSILHKKIKVAYLAVNRYEFIIKEDMCLDFPDRVDQCIDLIVSRCDNNFCRLYQPAQVDGNHFVGIHGLDVFVYERY